MRACWPEFDLPTAAVLCLGTLVVAFAILTTIVILTLAMPGGDDLVGFGTLSDPDGTVVARSIPSAATD